MKKNKYDKSQIKQKLKINILKKVIWSNISKNVTNYQDYILIKKLLKIINQEIK